MTFIKHSLPIFILTTGFFLAISFTSCEKCKECFLIENSQLTPTETAVGQRCDQEIKDLEAHDVVCLHPDCYYECR